MTRSDRRVFEASKAIALVSLACLSIGLLWSIQAATHVSTWDQVITHDAWAERAAFAYEPLLADGSGPLAMGQPGYFTHDAPTVRLKFTWTLEDDATQRVSALGTMKLVVWQGVTQGRPAWTYEEPLGEGTLAGAAGDPLVIEGVLDLVATQARIEGTPGRTVSGATWVVAAHVRSVSAPDTSHASDASVFEMPITYAAPLYAFPPEPALGMVHDHTQRETVTHSQTGGAAALAARPVGPVLVLAGLLGLARTIPDIARDEEDFSA